MTFFCGAPFATTASPEDARCWAGRADVHSRLRRLSHFYRSRPDSSLDLMWANLGSGKSHALQHFALMLEQDLPQAVTVYLELPENIKSFTDLYRRIATKIFSVIDPAELVSDIGKGDLDRACRAYAFGDVQQRGALFEWLTGGNPSLRDMRSIAGISRRIDDDSIACEVLSEIVRQLAYKERRLVIMIDEFQRIATAKPSARAAILSNLRSVFSANATYFSLIIAAACFAERSAVELLTQELRTLAAMRPTITLPELDAAEAMEFLEGRLAFFRPGGYSGDRYAPFGEEGLALIIQRLEESELRLTPRALLQAAGLVYDEVDFRGSSAADDDIVNFALSALKHTA